MITKTEQEVDWERVYQYIGELVTDIEKDLNQKLSFLELVEPVTDLEKFPPRISIWFKPKGKEELKSRALFQQVSSYERELERNQEKISLIIAEIAKEKNLEAKAGRFSIMPITLSKGVTHFKRVYSYEVGDYTLQPFYKQFMIND